MEYTYIRLFINDAFALARTLVLTSFRRLLPDEPSGNY